MLWWRHSPTSGKHRQAAIEPPFVKLEPITEHEPYEVHQECPVPKAEWRGPLCRRRVEPQDMRWCQLMKMSGALYLLA